MEMLIYFKSLGRYLSESPEHIRDELVKELFERLHRKTDSRLVDATGDSDETRYRLAKLIVRDPGAPASVLSRLAFTDDREILERIAEHPRVSSYTLAALSRHDHPDVRMAVAENTNTPRTVLLELVEDDHPDVRYRLAENPNVCLTILARLEEDDNPYVSMRASQTLERVKSGCRAFCADCAACQGCADCAA